VPIEEILWLGNPNVFDFCLKHKLGHRLHESLCITAFLLNEKRKPNSELKGLLSYIAIGCKDHPYIKTLNNKILTESYIKEYIMDMKDAVISNYKLIQNKFGEKWASWEDFQSIYLSITTRVFGGPEKIACLDYYGDIINTNKNKLQNTKWTFTKDKSHVFKAKRSIKKGEELFTTYMPEWSNLMFYSVYGFTLEGESSRFEHPSLIMVGNPNCNSFKMSIPPSIDSLNINLFKDEKVAIECLREIKKTLEEQLDLYPTEIEV
jgi:hypothetical protein